jgi:hypothetical protein
VGGWGCAGIHVAPVQYQRPSGEKDPGGSGRSGWRGSDGLGGGGGGYVAPSYARPPVAEKDRGRLKGRLRRAQ